MSSKAAITVHRSREEAQRLWESSEYVHESVTFTGAPGDRGTEIHVDRSPRPVPAS